MATVDNRIVSMTFDNKMFEQRASDTMKTLGALDKSIANLGAKNGLADLNKSVGKFNLGGMGSAIDGLSAKFLALSTIGITALANITNKAVDAGLRMAKSLTIQPVLDGFAEYELKMGSIQTILANTARHGTTLEDVTRELDALNEYSDKTIYNFGQMTKNIGLFTNAGIKIEDATSMIQGFSNVAAASGTNAEGAASAAYQLSQALSAGTIRLMDWKSLTNVGMGNKNMQEGLVQIADSMGLLNEETGNSMDIMANFNASLETNWLSADVMSNYLRIMAGDMNDAEMASLGLTEAQINLFKQQQQTAEDAATKVRTFSQLMNTVRESIGSGWAETFQIVFGDFEEATALFTSINDVIGGFVQENAAARNSMLQGWKEMGGRDKLIDGVRQAFKALSEIMAPIKEAFQTIFPPTTASRLYELTEGFRNLMARMRPSGETVDRLRRIFLGLFNVVRIVFDLFSMGVGVVRRLFGELNSASDGAVLEFFAKIGDFLYNLSAPDLVSGIEKLGDTLVGAFKKIPEALSELLEMFKNPVPAIKQIGEAIGEFFANLDFNAPDLGFLNKLLDPLREFFDGFGFDIPEFGGLDGLDASSSRIATRFEDIMNKFEWARDNLWIPVREAFDKVAGVFVAVKDEVSDWFDGIMDALSEAFAGGDYSGVADAVSIGLLGAIGAGIYKLLKDGIKLDLTGGLIDKVKGIFDGLTQTLGAMQAKLKSEALLNIAFAIGAMTASVLVLSLIDSEALAKALTAMSVGFGQLLASFALLQKLNVGPASSLQFIGIAAGLTLLAGAILILAFAAKQFAGLDWQEIAKGLTGVAGTLVAIATTAKILNSSSADLTGLGARMIAIGTGMLLISIAAKVFSTMSWERIAKGLVGTAGGLASTGTAMKAFPDDLASRSANITAVAAAMLIMAFAVEKMSGLDWVELAKGIGGVVVGLAGMGKAMQFFPKNLSGIAGTVLVVSFAMIILAKAVKAFADIPFGDLVKGALSMSITLGLLGIAMKTLSGSLLGAVGLFILVAGLGALADVLNVFADMGFKTLAIGLISISVALGTLAGVAYLLTPAIIPMMGLGAAFFLLGAGIGILGGGLGILIGAFVKLSKVGPEGAENITRALMAIAKAIPALISGFALGMIELGKMLLVGISELAGPLGDAIVSLMGVFRKILPQTGGLIKDLIAMILDVITGSYSKLVQAGYDLLLAFLGGIADNIGPLVSVAVDIVTNFLDAMSKEMPRLRESLVNYIKTTFEETARAIGELAGGLMLGVGVSFMAGFYDGITQELGSLFEFFGNMIEDIIDFIKSGFGIFSPSKVMELIGIDLVAGFLKGIVKEAEKVFLWFKNLANTILTKVGNLASTLLSKGTTLIAGLYTGIYNRWVILSEWLTGLPSRIANAIGNLTTYLVAKGYNLIVGFYNGILDKWNDVKAYLSGLADRVSNAIGDTYTMLRTAGKNLVIGLWNGIVSMGGWLKDKIRGWGQEIINTTLGVFGINSPSRVFAEIGMGLNEGLAKGILESERLSTNAVTSVANGMIGAFEDSEAGINSAFAAIVAGLESDMDFSPVVTPVIDLSNVRTGAATMASLIGGTSYSQASLIASSRSAQAQALTEETAAGINFVQNNNSPKALSTADIYRQSKNLLAFAKDNLEI